MDASLYKLVDEENIGNYIELNDILNDSSNEIDSKQLREIIEKNQIFFEGNYEDSIKSLKFLIDSIPKSPDSFQNYLFKKYNYFQKLLQINNLNTQLDELKSIFQFTYIILTSPSFKSITMDLSPLYNFCIFETQNLIHNQPPSDTFSIIIQYSLDDIVEMVNENNFHLLNQSFFTDLLSVCFYNDHIKTSCSQIIEKVSRYVPKIHQYKYFFDFIKFFCSRLHPVFAFYMYKSLLNILKRYPEVRIPSEKVDVIEKKSTFSIGTNSYSKFWVYEMILNVYRYDVKCQSVVFEICAVLNNDSICILEDGNLKRIVLNNLMRVPENGDFLISSILMSLVHYIKIDPKNCAKNYFSSDISLMNLSSSLIKLILNAPFNIKVSAGFLWGFAMCCSPNFFAKSFLKIYSSRKNLMLDIESKEEALLILLEIDSTDLLIQIISGLISIERECRDLCVIDELFETFSKSVCGAVNNLKSNENENVSKLANQFFALLCPQESNV